MTNLAQQDTSASTDQCSTGNLPLHEGTISSTTIYISLQGDTPVFSSYQWHGPYYSGGICWRYRRDRPTKLHITFNLQRGIREITSISPNLSVGPSKDGTQECWVSRKSAHDCFTVVKTGGGSHDPEIVVTPI